MTKLSEHLLERLDSVSPKVGALVADGVSEQDLTSAMHTYHGAGCSVRLIASREGLIQSWGDGALGHSFLVDERLDETDETAIDLLFLPGGQRAVASLSDDNTALRFISDFARTDKPVAAVHDAWALLAPEDCPQADTREGVAINGNIVVAAPETVEDAAFASLAMAAQRLETKPRAV